MMKRLHSLLPALLITGFMAFAISCSPEACFEETNSFLKASFYNDSTKKQLAPDSVTLTGLNQPANKIYDRAAGVQPALFPLDASAGSCTFEIRINGVTDTIQFSYTSFPHLVSKECGYTFYHNLDTFSYSKNAIDYIYRSSNSITTANEENIRIFY
jgi:hypothetical protein